MAGVGIGTGVTLLGAVSGLIPNIIDLSWSGRSVPMIDITTNDSSGGREFTPGSLPDPGELTVTVKLDDTTVANIPALGAAVELWTVDNANETYTCNGSVSSIDFGWPHEAENTMSFTIKFTGEVAGTHLTA